MSSNHLHRNAPENIHDKHYPATHWSSHFESDTKKIVRRHLQDKDHIITEEEIASIRVGMTPPHFEGGSKD